MAGDFHSAGAPYIICELIHCRRGSFDHKYIILERSSYYGNAERSMCKMDVKRSENNCFSEPFIERYESFSGGSI